MNLRDRSQNGPKLVTNGASGMMFEEFALKDVLAFASRSKAKAKPRRRASACSSSRTAPICERSWTDIEARNLFAHRLPSVERLNSGDQKEKLRNEFGTLSTLV